MSLTVRACFRSASFDKITERLADRLSKRDMANNSAAEEGGIPFLCAVDELINDDQVTRGGFFAQPATSRHREYVLHTEFLHRPDVRLERHLCGEQTMPLAM